MIVDDNQTPPQEFDARRGGAMEDDMDEMKVNVYVRVSTTAQDEGNSLDTQASACVKLAQEHGYTAHSADVMREMASGLGLDRPQLNELRRMVAANEVDALFVYKSDRLVRNASDLLNLLWEFRDAGVVVHSVDGSLSHLVQLVTGVPGRGSGGLLRVWSTLRSRGYATIVRLVKRFSAS